MTVDVVGACAFNAHRIMIASRSDAEIAGRNGEDGDQSLELVLDDYPLSHYSNNDIRRAGRIIASARPIFGDVPEDIIEAFRIAYNWRDAHAFPMQSVRGSIGAYMRQEGLQGITAARLKRMPAIRKKLNRVGLGLNQLQDLAGCRVILSSIEDTRRLADILTSRLLSEQRPARDYIADPKADGYRSHHMIVGFRHNKPTPFDGKRVEIQMRTRLQHAWATCVEAIGLFRGEELKNGHGDAEWLRLFALMSGHFAAMENCAPVPGVPEPGGRRREIRDLAGHLKAVTMLESVSHGTRGYDVELAPGYKPDHLLIRYDSETKQVRVEAHKRPLSATASYDLAEEQLRAAADKDVVVLVEVDKIENLKAAYPNYFGDVELFKQELRNIVLGRSAAPYSAVPRLPVVRPAREPRIDPSWLRGSPSPGPRLSPKGRKKRR